MTRSKALALIALTSLEVATTAGVAAQTLPGAVSVPKSAPVTTTTSSTTTASVSTAPSVSQTVSSAPVAAPQTTSPTTATASTGAPAPSSAAPTTASAVSSVSTSVAPAPNAVAAVANPVSNPAPSGSPSVLTTTSGSVAAIQPQSSITSGIVAPGGSAPSAGAPQSSTAPVQQVVATVSTAASHVSAAAPAPAVAVPTAGGGSGASAYPTHLTPSVTVPSVSTTGVGPVSDSSALLDGGNTAQAVLSDATTAEMMVDAAAADAVGAPDSQAAGSTDTQSTVAAPTGETAPADQPAPSAAAASDPDPAAADASTSASSPSAPAGDQPVWVAMMDGQPVLIYADGSTSPVPPDTRVYVMTENGPVPFDPATAPVISSRQSAADELSEASADSAINPEIPTTAADADAALQSADAIAPDAVMADSAAPTDATILADSSADMAALEPLPSLPAPLASSGNPTDLVAAAFAPPPVAAASTTADAQQYAQARPTPLPVIGRAPAPTDPETAGVQATSADRTSILVQVLPQAIAPAINAMLPSTGGPGAAALGGAILAMAAAGLSFRRLGTRKKVSR